MSNIKNIINNIQSKDLVTAKNLIKEELLNRIGNVLEEQIELIAPSMITEKAEESKNNSEDKKKSMAWKKDKKSKTDESYEAEQVITPKNKIAIDDETDIDFEEFVNEIQEIVQEIEDETGEELTEEEIQELGQEYLNMLSEELDSDDVIEEELKGNQHKIDANKNGEVDGEDFELLRNKNKNKKGK